MLSHSSVFANIVSKCMIFAPSTKVNSDLMCFISGNSRNRKNKNTFILRVSMECVLELKGSLTTIENSHTSQSLVFIYNLSTHATGHNSSLTNHPHVRQLMHSNIDTMHT